MTVAPRRRWPIGATVLTAIMLPVLLGLSYWQFAVRRPWKHDLIARLEAAKTLPPVDSDDYDRARRGAVDLQYRRAEVDCRPGRIKPYDLKGGTSASDVGGFLVLIDCALPAGRTKPTMVVVAGWTLRPDRVVSLDVVTHFTGVLIEHPYGNAPERPQLMLIPTTAVPPLTASRLPTPDDLPDSHLSYAFQWLAFAITLAVVYAVYLRQWRRTEHARLPM